MTLVKLDMPAMLSIYRFHDHQPIRFNQSLRWHIKLAEEKHMGPKARGAEVGRSVGARALLGGLRHGLLLVSERPPAASNTSRCPPVAERAKPLLRSSTQPAI
jgi:hypothetical protein